MSNSPISPNDSKMLFQTNFDYDDGEDGRHYYREWRIKWQTIYITDILGFDEDLMTHGRLVEEAKRILREKGFDEDEISEEHTIILDDGSFIIVDVVGIQDERTIAIECGQSAGLPERLKALEKHFDEVLRVPYYIRDGNKFKCMKCGYVWRARVENPMQCPRCKTVLGTRPNPKGRDE
jgi:hypothetical protein